MTATTASESFADVPAVSLLSPNSTANRQSLCLYLGQEFYARCSADFNKFDLPYMNDLKDTTTGSPLFPDYVLPSKYKPQEHLKVDKLTEQLVEQLLKLYPAPSSLIVSTAPGAFTESLLILLAAWSSSLTSFKLYTPTDPFPDEANNEEEELFAQGAARLLLGVINSMSSLRHLTVQWNDTFLDDSDSDSGLQLDLPILGQLEELYFYSHDEVDVLSNSLLKYGQTNDNLQVVALPGYLDKKHRLGFGMSPEFLATRFTQLNFSLRGYDRDWIGRSPTPWPCFASLTVLDLNIALYLDTFFDIDGDPFSLSEFLHYLVPLKQLLHLKMTLNTGDVVAWRDELADMKRSGNFGPLQDKGGNWLTVPSLKMLTLHFVEDPLGDFGDSAIESHDDLAALQLHRFFPAVQVLILSIDQFEGFSCNDCLDTYGEDFKRWENTCIPPMVNSARHFKNLLYVEAVVLAFPYCERWEAEELEDEDENYADLVD